MTLKEKFLPFVDWMDLQDDCTDRNWALRNANKCVDVADEFAIGFAEWLRENYYDNGELWTEWNSDDNTHSSKKLLEIYKKEKGL